MAHPTRSALEPFAKYFWVKVQKSDGCWVWTAGLSGNGYGRFAARQEGISVKYPAHKVAYVLCVSDIPEELKVLHKCDNKPCCNPEHLFVGTQADNMEDASIKGRIPGNRVNNLRGEAHGMAKLRWWEVRRIRELCADGRLTQRQIAARFGIGQTQVWRILHDMTWVGQ